jgi:hypothetical protein
MRYLWSFVRFLYNDHDRVCTPAGPYATLAQDHAGKWIMGYGYDAQAKSLRLLLSSEPPGPNSPGKAAAWVGVGVAGGAWVQGDRPGFYAVMVVWRGGARFQRQQGQGVMRVMAIIKSVSNASRSV